MKTIKHILYLITFTIIIASCDKIEEPYLREGASIPDTSSTAVRKVLLEDYTGHRCINCPGAAITAHDLKDLFGDQLIILSVHAGFFAMPLGEYTEDFRTEAGEDWDSFFGISLQGNPNGMVNRREFGQSLILGPEEWGSNVAEVIEEDADALLEIKHNYNEAEKTIDGKVNIEFLQALNGTYRLSIVLTESGIIAPQKNSDETIGPVPDWTDYEHNHLMRAALNGSWGTIVNQDNIIIGHEYEVEIPSFILETEWVADNCELIAFLFSCQTNEIVQAEKIKLK